jgi:cytidine deaminase
MQQLTNTMPDTVTGNILTVFSRVSFAEQNQFDTNMLPFSAKPENLFYLKCDAFTVATPSSPGLREDLTRDWDRCMSSFGAFIDRVMQLGPTAVVDFTAMRENRDQVKFVLNTVRLKIRQLQDVQIQLNEVEQEMSVHKGAQSQYQNFTQKKVVTSVVFDPVEYQNTICGECSSVCHSNCQLEPIDEKGSHDFTNCWAFSGKDSCTPCGGCSYTLHYHAKMEPKKVSNTLEEVNEFCATR